ncbi:PTS system galactitol-specific IIA component [Clostridium acetobutylicum]|uniref:PTS system enzyme IIBC component (Galactitol/fructose specific) n=1 Tax=Clostridium acetobutylicum (strain ATCC 824 / DSM 792 / JCM 1419 / IAM 19013 / LMG 5710 / NBRC 13948 / NRRL B-527 / VKM B-1787 / 2291 / W) TaxID=272562 RepID=Q97EZ7_CLOAB|nr:MULTISPECIES: PTS sugar transporter subunit IIA [Clostridium]AAK80900.1 PTS system enzyme IIBC component (galactitol/fructose specific) [Clostridium acetobutylicum ATCC 824]ADZ22002.1 PTS system enzyme IIBC component (galactitol/fructose specific) [Clostridium acetobutylicum EA 2018]AEI34326.1 PTS system enzyme IIBC component (galactitol/fructose specific) [Clostridium acetobutylicum DSM 1731]AWV78688.1 PTS sugar transporter subunit IIA [Clostridium acetobutylicum]KHD37261.1 PTS fructose tr
MIKEISNLFKEDLIFIEDAKDSNEIFKKIGQRLIQKGLVKDNFIDGIIEREKKYPTGMDLSVIEGQEYNVAIPHTEREYCLSKRIVFVKLKKEVEFKNMIAPEDTLKVRYLFMIINNENDAQTNILANIMDFITNKENMDKLNKTDNEEEIFEFITDKQTIKNI